MKITKRQLSARLLSTRFVQWHKDRLNCAADHFGLSTYQMLWITLVKGVVLGYLVGAYL